jgi:hypothetical protein
MLNLAILYNLENKKKIIYSILYITMVRKDKKGGALKVGVIQEFINASSNFGKVEKVDNFIIDSALSDKWTQIYWNQNLNKGVIMNRQTEDLRDILSDIKAGLNLFKTDKRFVHGWAVMDKAKKKYNGLDKFEGIGYSLGAIVLEHYKNADEFSHVYFISKPVLPIDIYNGLKPLKNATEIRSKFDPTSTLKPWQDEAPESILITAKTINPLKEHKQGEVLSRLDKDQVVGGMVDIKKMKVADLKALIKQLRKGDAKSYPIAGKNKKELVEMVKNLMFG